MPDNAGLWSPTELPNRAAHDEKVYTAAQRLAGALDGDWDLTEEVKELRDELLKALGPPDPFVDPPAFKVERLDATDWIVTCTRCDNGIIVHGPTWVAGGTKEEGSRSTRMCPYCGEESKVIDADPKRQRKTFA